MKTKESLMITLFVITAYMWYLSYHNNLIVVESMKGDKVIIQKDDFVDVKADLMRNIIKRLRKLKNHLVNNIDQFPEYEKYIKQLNRNFNNNTIIYENSLKSSTTSFTINKGDEMVFCLSSRSTGLPHDINLLTYVAVHELSHVASDSVGHDETFNKIFAFFLKQAINIGIYKYEDYQENPVEYCNMTLSSNILN